MKPTASGRVPASGDLREHDLISVLKQLYEDRATGKLVVRSGKITKAVQLRDGGICFAISNLREDRLGETLLRLGRINPQQYRASVDLIKKTGQQQGAILVQAGFLTARELFEGLKEQVREIICSLFLWEEGQYKFVNEEPEAHTIALHLDMVELLSDILKRIQDREGLEEGSNQG